MNTKNALLKLMIYELQKKDIDDIPKGYFSTQECADEMNRSLWIVRKKLRALAKEGKLERKLFRVKSSSGAIINTPYYKKITK